MSFGEFSNVSKSHLTSSRILLDFIGKIRDPLHDTISMTAAEKFVIDSEEFQRLRRITQTAFIKYVFPGANHSRFEHSLGVMHMSGIMLSSLMSNQENMLRDLLQQFAALPNNAKEEFRRREEHEGSLLATTDALQMLQTTPYLTQCLRFAALLHDVGHTPFSHSGERFLPTWREVQEQLATLDIPDFLKSGIANKLKKLSQKNVRFLDQKVRHELYTLFIVARIFNHSDENLSPKMGQDVCSLIDTSISPNPSSPLAKSGLQWLLHEIISGELDVDRMDYLMRDSRNCGVVYGLFDAARILDSACFYFDNQTQRYHLAMRKRGVPALEDYLRARWSMYQQVYFHKTSTACEAMLEFVHKKIPDLKLTLKVDDFLKLDDYSFYGEVEKQYRQQPDASFALNVLKDLVFYRRLWKRVYEESHPKSVVANLPSLCPTVQMFLNTNQIPNEMIESGTSLTRFSPKSRGGVTRSENVLKVVVKDLHGLRYLEPIENHSALVNRVDEDMVIKRIFVSLQKSSKEPLDFEAIKKLVSDGVVTVPPQH